MRDFSVRITSFETIGVLPRVLLLSPRSRLALEHRVVAEPARVFRLHYAARSPIGSGIVILLRMPTCRTSRSLSLPRHTAGTCRALTASDQTPVTDARRRVRHHRYAFLLIPPARPTTHASSPMSRGLFVARWRQSEFEPQRSWVQIRPHEQGVVADARATRHNSSRFFRRAIPSHT